MVSPSLSDAQGLQASLEIEQGLQRKKFSLETQSHFLESFKIAGVIKHRTDGHCEHKRQENGLVEVNAQKGYVLAKNFDRLYFSKLTLTPAIPTSMKAVWIRMGNRSISLMK